MKPAKEKPGRSANGPRLATNKVFPAPHDLMQALSQDLCGGKIFTFVLNRAEARALSKLDDYRGIDVTVYNLGCGEESDSLTRAHVALARGIGFMNPPHYLMRDVARVAALRGAVGRPTVLLGPVGTGTLWFDEYVSGRADVYFLKPRIPFQGFKAGHRSDFFAAVYPPVGKRGPFATYLYDWKTGEKRLLGMPSPVDVR